MCCFSLLDLFYNLCHGRSLLPAATKDIIHLETQPLYMHSSIHPSIFYDCIFCTRDSKNELGSCQEVPSKQIIHRYVVKSFELCCHHQNPCTHPERLSEPSFTEPSRSLESCLCSLCLLLPSCSLDDCLSRRLR